MVTAGAYKDAIEKGAQQCFLINLKIFFKYMWQVEKFLNGGSLNNCWLTTSVSLPTSLGSSI